MIDLIQPTGILSKYIQNYIIVETNSSIDFLPKERVYPTGYATMVFHYGKPSLFQKLNSPGYIEPNLVICGQQTSSYDLSLSGKTAMILVAFKPHGVKSFFDIPITEIVDENIPLQNLVFNEAIELENKLLDVHENKQRIIHLENFLTKRLTPNNDFERIEYAVELIGNSKGQIKTHDTAFKVCLGIKQFERIFMKNVGMNPKKYASIVRLQNVMQLIKKHNNISMSQLAYDCGFYDQAHFVHDFKSFTGLPPKEYFNNLK
jgi:AraC-like DNA-binding protein